MQTNELTTNCLRCGTPCRRGTPDPKARAIVQSATGFCPNCMITRFFLEIFLNADWREKTLRPVIRSILGREPKETQ